MKTIRLLVIGGLIASALASSPITLASQTIAGVWNHAFKPASIEFNLKAGTARVKEHHTHIENTGWLMIKNIVPLPDSGNQWQGKIFNGYENKYVAVTTLFDRQAVSIVDEAKDLEL